MLPAFKRLCNYSASLTKKGSFSSFDNIIKTKGLENATQLAEETFWDKIYESESSQTEWYINSNHAARFVRKILHDKGMLKLDKLNIFLEIGCGSAPITIPLIKTFKNSPFMVTGVSTDFSTSCITKLRKSNSNTCSRGKRAVFRDDDDILTSLEGDSNCKGKLHSMKDLTGGVMCQVLDVKDMREIHENLQYFPVTNPEFYERQVGAKNLYKTNIIVIEKGCLDALIWDGNFESVSKVLNYCDSIVSISGEDPDSRLEYFQSTFGKLFSVHFVNGAEVFAYSYNHKEI